MTSWVGLLRAVNVGGRKLKMDELRRIVDDKSYERFAATPGRVT